ncbi:hypothetical protein [Streptomyces sp. NPDC058240]|uniref:hypothetical protein n=1 Tax=Streptomyces sp. NPDC058240 TaxID=3346396 RepID=UPI0036EBD5CD
MAVVGCAGGVADPVRQEFDLSVVEEQGDGQALVAGSALGPCVGDAEEACRRLDAYVGHHLNEPDGGCSTLHRMPEAWGEEVAVGILQSVVRQPLGDVFWAVAVPTESAAGTSRQILRPPVSGLHDRAAKGERSVEQVKVGPSPFPGVRVGPGAEHGSEGFVAVVLVESEDLVGGVEESVLVNPAAAQILGYRTSRLGGQEPHSLIPHSLPMTAPSPREARQRIPGSHRRRPRTHRRLPLSRNASGA